MRSEPSEIRFREEVRVEDIESIRRIVESTGFFYPEEVEVSVELVEDRLSNGLDSGYFFLIAEREDLPVTYSCYGPIACTFGSFDIFWIVVHKDCQGVGLGKQVMEKTEERIRSLRGRAVYIETSSRDLYEPTRAFYRRCDYRVEAVLKDFYSPGDDKMIFVKRLQ
jgi:ribosomal protein S18 acetylase RimI-like enzyme